MPESHARFYSLPADDRLCRTRPRPEAVLRLKPRGFDSQHVQNWYVGVEPDARLRRSEDAFGNIVHSCSHDGPLDRLTISAEGEIETHDTAGVVRGPV